MNNTSQEEIRGYNAQLQTELASCKKKVKELEAENKRLLGEVVKGNQRDTSRAEEVRVLNMLVDTLRGKESEDG